MPNHITYLLRDIQQVLQVAVSWFKPALPRINLVRPHPIKTRPVRVGDDVFVIFTTVRANTIGRGVGGGPQECSEERIVAGLRLTCPLPVIFHQH